MQPKILRFEMSGVVPVNRPSGVSPLFARVGLLFTRKFGCATASVHRNASNLESWEMLRARSIMVRFRHSETPFC